MTVNIATTDTEIENCFAAMHELRPHLTAETFLARVKKQQADGYRLAYIPAQDGSVVATAGFRIAENLAWGLFLYVDDMVTLPGYRSSGYGATLLAWLKSYAMEHGCTQMHLDSGMQREAAHRFYEREGMAKTGYHFAVLLD